MRFSAPVFLGYRQYRDAAIPRPLGYQAGYIRQLPRGLARDIVDRTGVPADMDRASAMPQARPLAILPYCATLSGLRLNPLIGCFDMTLTTR